jgi:hypothetical protein
MKFVPTVALFALVILFEGYISGNAQATVVVVSNESTASVSDGTDSWSTSTTDTTIPLSAMLDTPPGSGYSNNEIEWSTTGSQTTLSFDLEHSRVGTASAMSKTYFDLFFTIDSVATYDVSGFYNVTDTGAGQNGNVEFHVRLSDSLDFDLFDSYLISTTTPNEDFSLGSLGGDTLDYLVGSPLGSLNPGTYRLFINAAITANPDTDLGARALGDITLTINSGVPEPSSLLLVMGILGFVSQSRRVR